VLSRDRGEDVVIELHLDPVSLEEWRHRSFGMMTSLVLMLLVRGFFRGGVTVFETDSNYAGLRRQPPFTPIRRDVGDEAGGSIHSILSRLKYSASPFSRAAMASARVSARVSSKATPP